MPACAQCSGHIPDGAAWCGQCYAPVGSVATSGAAVTAAAYAAVGAPLPSPTQESPSTGTATALLPGWRPPADELPALADPKNGALAAAGRSTILVLVAIGAGAAAQWIIGRIARGGHATSNDLVNDGLTLTLMVYLVVGILLALFVTKTKTALVWHTGDPVVSVGRGLVRGLLMAGIVTLIVRSATGKFQGDPRFTSLLAEDNPLRIMLTIGIGVLAAPLVEETLFRGVLLESWRSHARVALILSGFAFAAWHLNGSAIIYYWILGLILGRCYMRHGLVGSMTAHAAFNTVVLGITIANVVGGGHTYDAAGLRLHAPSTWQRASTTGTLDLGLRGPSGSALLVVHRALAPGETIDSIAAKARSNVSRSSVLSGNSITGNVAVVDLPIGRAIRADVSTPNQTAQVYVVTTSTELYELEFDTGSSATATKQIPGILDSLSFE